MKAILRSEGEAKPKNTVELNGKMLFFSLWFPSHKLSMCRIIAAGRNDHLYHVSTGTSRIVRISIWYQKPHLAHLVEPLLPAGQCVEPGTVPHHTALQSWPLPLTADRMYSMTRCHTLTGHVSDHAHRICWMIHRIREKEVDQTFRTKT